MKHLLILCAIVVVSSFLGYWLAKTYKPGPKCDPLLTDSRAEDCEY